MKWKSWKIMPDEMRTEVRKQLSTYYNLEDLDNKSLAYVNRLFVERYKQWKCDMHHHFQAFDDPQVALQEGCPKELEGREDSWTWLCSHFQEPDYVKKTNANKGNRDKKTLLHHSGSRPFSYRMEARRRVIGRRPRTYCRGMGNARRQESRTPSSSQSNSQVIALRAEVAELKTQLALFSTQMSQFLESLARSGIPIPHFGPSSTSKPLQPEHGHHTSTPVDNVRTSEPHLQDDHVDF
ncbi:hypothetical protein ACE6H2_023998 [Prunus campanulata]